MQHTIIDSSEWDPLIENESLNKKKKKEKNKSSHMTLLRYNADSYVRQKHDTQI